jgi:uracil phosphoribosyltransferase
MKNVRVIRHPLVRHHLAVLRDRATPPELFAATVRRLSVLLAYEATADLPLRPMRVRTPLAPARAERLAGRLGLVPILRAGLGMVGPILDLIPQAQVWHLGFYRDETTLRPVAYYNKLPRRPPLDAALVLDPMLATGGSAVAALEAVARGRVPDVRLLAMIAAPEGLRLVARRFPAARVFVCAIDERLNAKGYILPGLGDAGDRLFNTRPGPDAG